MKITRRQLRQIIKEEIRLVEAGPSMPPAEAAQKIQEIRVTLGDIIKRILDASPSIGSRLSIPPAEQHQVAAKLTDKLLNGILDNLKTIEGLQGEAALNAFHMMSQDKATIETALRELEMAFTSDPDTGEEIIDDLAIDRIVQTLINSQAMETAKEAFGHIVPDLPI